MGLCLSDFFITLLSSVECSAVGVVPLAVVRPGYRRCWRCDSHSKKAQEEASNKNLHYGVTEVLLCSTELEEDDLMMGLIQYVLFGGAVSSFIGIG